MKNKDMRYNINYDLDKKIIRMVFLWIYILLIRIKIKINNYVIESNVIKSNVEKDKEKYLDKLFDELKINMRKRLFL